jgi:hypothetical protein
MFYYSILLAVSKMFWPKGPFYFFIYKHRGESSYYHICVIIYVITLLVADTNNYDENINSKVRIYK